MRITTASQARHFRMELCDRSANSAISRQQRWNLYPTQLLRGYGKDPVL